MLKQFSGGLRQLKNKLFSKGSAMVADQSGNVFTMLFGAVALTGVLAGVGMQTITGPVTTITRVTQKNITDTHLLTNASIVIANAIDGDFDSDGIIEPVEYLAAGSGDCGTSISGGGCLPTTLGATRTDPWGTMYAYCVWDHGLTIDGRNDSGGGSSLNRLAGTDTSIETRPVIAIVSAGPNKSFETSCAAYDGSGGEGVVEASGSDDFIFTRTYAEASASGGGLWQLKPTDSDIATIEKDLEIGTGANQVSVDSTTGVGTFIGVTTNTIAAKDTNVVGVTGGFLPDVKSAFTTCGGTEEGSLRINDDVSGDPILEICDGAGTWNPISGKGTTIDDDEDTFMLVDDGSGNDTDIIEFYAGSDATPLMTIHNNGTVTVANTLAVTGAATVGTTLGVTGAVTMDSTLGVAGLATLDSASVTNNAIVGGTLDVTGETTLSSNLGVGGTANVTGATTLSSTLGVTGATTLSSTLGVTGDATMSANAIVVGDLTVDTDTLHVDSTNDRVGVGTTAPLHKLHVVGGDAQIETDGAAELNVRSTDGAGDAVLGLAVDGDTWQIINDTSNSNDLQFAFNNSVAVTIEDDGKVGIGTSSPDALLDVDGGIKIGNHTDCAPGGGNNGTMRYNSTDDQMQVCVDGVWQGVSSIETLDDIGDVNVPSPNGDEVLAWNAVDNRWEAKALSAFTGGTGGGKWEETGNDIYYTDGNVGIGTDTPLLDALSIIGDAVIREDDNGNTALRLSADNTNGIITVLQGGSVNTRITGDSSAATYFNAGNVGIGTDSPGARLEVAGGIKIGEDTASCTAAKAGTLRYDEVSRKMEMCDENNWLEISAGAGGGGGAATLSALTDTDIGAPTDRQVLSYDAGTGNWVPANQLGTTAKITYSMTFGDQAQTFSTMGVEDIEVFKIGSYTYMIFAESRNNSTGNNITQTLRRMGPGDVQFQNHQVMPVPTTRTQFNWVYDWVYYQIGSEHYLMAVADGETTNGLSQIYKWNATTELFENHQEVTSHQLKNAHVFARNGEHYMVLPHYYDGDWNTNIDVLKYNSSNQQFEAHQSFAHAYGNGWAVDTIDIDGTLYMAASQYYHPSYSYTSTRQHIYAWNDGTEQFTTTPHQAITSPDWANDVELFQIGSRTFLIFASAGSSSSAYAQRFFEWNSTTNQFDSFQSITNVSGQSSTYYRMLGVRDWDYVRIGESHFLLQAHDNNGVNSTSSTYNGGRAWPRLFEFTGSQFQYRAQHSFWSNYYYPRAIEFFEHDANYYVISGLWRYSSSSYQNTSRMHKMNTDVKSLVLEPGVITSGIPQCNTGEVLTGNNQSFECVAGGGGAGGGATADGDGDTRIQVEESTDEDKIRFDTSNIERMIIDDLGNVGIGTSDPSSTLQVIGGIQFSDDASACTAPKFGTLRYTGGNVQLCDNSGTWQTLGGSGGGGGFDEWTGDVLFSSAINAGWNQDGNSLDNLYPVTGYLAIGALDSSTIAYYDQQNDELRTYTWDGTDFTQDGNALTITDANSSRWDIGVLDSNTIVLASPSDTNSLRTYQWDSVNWNQMGNGLAITGNSHVSVDALNASTIAYFDRGNEELRTYSWDGTDWSMVGNALDISSHGQNASVAALDAATVVVYSDESGSDTLSTYSWDGTDWTLVGNRFTIANNSGDVTALTSSTIAVVDESTRAIQQYSWDGTDWSAVGNATVIYTGSNMRPQLTALDNDTIVVGNYNDRNLEVHSITSAVPAQLADTGNNNTLSNAIGTNTPFYVIGSANNDGQYISGAIIDADTIAISGDWSSAGTESGVTIKVFAGGGGGGGSGSAGLVIDNDSDTRIQVEESPDEDKIRFDTEGVQRAVITETGEVGIGTDTPQAQLDVAGGVRLGDDSAACTSANEGTLRYNSGALQVCVNDNWTDVGVDSDGTAFESLPAPAIGDSSWPDAIRCVQNSNGAELIYYLRYRNGSNLLYYYQNVWVGNTLRYNPDRTFQYSNTATSCDNKDIDQLVTDGQSYQFIGGLQGSIITGWPDVIECNNGSPNLFYYAGRDSTGQRFYYRHGSSDHMRYNADGSFNTSSSNGYADCEGKPINQIVGDNQSFDVVGGSGAGAILQDNIPDIVSCTNTSNDTYLFYNYYYEPTGTYNYYADSTTGSNYIRFFNSTGRLDGGYNFGSSSDCRNMSYSELYEAGKAFDILNDDGGPMGGLPQDGELNTADTGYFVVGWPDAIKCTDGSGNRYTLQRGSISSNGQTDYYTRYGSHYVRFNGDQTYGTNSGLSGSDCINKTITQIEDDGLAVTYRTGVSPATSVWLVYPDVIKCSSNGGSEDHLWFSHEDSSHIYYSWRASSSYYMRWNKSDLSYSTQSNVSANASCVNKSITQLVADGQTYNLVGGDDTGSMENGFPDIIMCRHNSNGLLMPFYLSDTTSNYLYYYGVSGTQYAYYRSQNGRVGEYYTTSDGNHDCTKSLPQLATDGRTYNLVETGNAEAQPVAEHSGDSMVEGWPDAIVCMETGYEPYVFWYAYRSGTTIFYYSYTENDTEYRIQFSLNGTWSGSAGISTNNCSSRSITELYRYGQAFNLLGSGGISVRSMIDQDEDTLIQVEESLDEDFIRFDTDGTERVVINNTGRVGVGTPAPATLLDVAGAIRVGDDSAPCAAGIAGALRYNSNKLQFCDGTNWLDVGNGTGVTSLVDLTDTDITGTPTDGDVLSYDNADGMWKAATYAAGGSIFTTQMDIVSIDAIQGLPADGAWDWEHFQIGSDHFLAVASERQVSSNPMEKIIYQWDGTTFNSIWSVDNTERVGDMEYMQIGTDHFVIMAKHYDGDYNVNHEILQWNGSSFASVQTLAGAGSYDAEGFQIGSDYYLYISGNRNASSQSPDGNLYKWNTGTTQFDAHQIIPTQGADDAEHFTVGGKDYLIIGNFYNGSTYNTTSKLYEWNTGTEQFDEVVAGGVSTSGVRDIEMFSFGGNLYMALAEWHNGSTQSLPMRIFQWNGSGFSVFQSDLTYPRTRDIEFFEMGSDQYLVSVHENTSNDIKIHKWNGTAFQLVETIDTSNEYIYGIEAFEINGVHYLMEAEYLNSGVSSSSTSYYNRSSTLHRLNTVVRSFEVQAGVAPSLVPTCGPEEVATADGTNFSCVPKNAHVIADDDGTASVNVETNVNEDKIRIRTGSAERVIIDENGLVGIGTSSPATTLDVEGGIQMGDVVAACDSTLHGTIRYNGGVMQLCDSSNSWQDVTTGGAGGSGGTMVANWPDAIMCVDGSTTLFYRPHNLPDSGNNYVYRTLSTSAPLVYDATGARTSGGFGDCTTKTIAQLYTDSEAFDFVGGGGGSGAGVIDADSDTKIEAEANADEDKLRFTTANNERMIIDETGKVGIGTSDPLTALDVVGSVKIGDETAICTLDLDGSMRFNSGKLQVCVNENWTDLSLNSGDGDSYALDAPRVVGDSGWPDVIRCIDNSNGTDMFFYFEYYHGPNNHYYYREPNSNYYIQYAQDKSYFYTNRASDCSGKSIDELVTLNQTHQFIGGTLSAMESGWPDVVRCEDSSSNVHNFYHYHEDTSNRRYYRNTNQGTYMMFNSDGTFNTSSSNGYVNCEGKSIAQLTSENVPADGRPATYDLVGGTGAGSMKGTGIPDAISCTTTSGHTYMYFAQRYETNSTYNYYSSIYSSGNVQLRFFNATQRADASYSTRTDCDGRTYAELYEAGQAFDLVNDIGGPMGGIVQDGQINPSATGYMVQGWPDFIVCSNSSGGTSILGRGAINTSAQTTYYSRYNNTYNLTFNGDMTHNSNSSNLNGSDCDNLSIADLETAGLTRAINDGTGSATSMISGWPDVVTCENPASYLKWNAYLAYTDATYAWYSHQQSSDYIRFLLTDGSYNSQNDMSSSDCIGQSIAALQLAGQTHNIIGGAKTGSMINSWPDAILCKHNSGGYIEPFFHTYQNSSPYATYESYASNQFHYNRNTGLYQSGSSNYDCYYKSINALITEERTRNFIDSSNENLQQPAGHDGGGSMVSGWPDALVCFESDGDPRVFWYSYESGSTVRYWNYYVYNTSTYIDYSLNGEYSSNSGTSTDCIGQSIQELQAYGQAFDLLGGGGISVRQMMDTDEDTLIHVEKSADEDVIRFDTDGLERMMIDASGNVGIGVTSPVARLEIDGGFRIGDDTGTCNGGYAGTMRYNSSKLQICDGLLWTDVGDGYSVSDLNDLNDVNAGAPGDNQVLAWDATLGEWQATDVLHGGIIEYDQSIKDVTTIQSDIQSAGSWDTITFSINNETYMMMANSVRNGNSYSNVPQRLFKWNGLKFVQHQLFNSGSGYDEIMAIEHFEVGGADYLVLGERRNSSGSYPNANTFLHKWNTSTEQFDLIQTLTIDGNNDMKAFTVGANTYLATASYYNGTSYNIASEIFVFNTGTEQLDPHHTINTSGAQAVDVFDIAGVTYIVYGEYYDGSSYNIDSRVYAWDTGLGEFNTTPVDGINNNQVYDVRYTTIDGKHYLIFASNGSNQVETYEWDGANWNSIQTLSISSIRKVEPFKINNDNFLMTIPYTSSNNVDIYQWVDNGYELLINNFSSTYMGSGAHVRIGTDDYVVVGRYYTGSSSTYETNSFTYRINSFVSSFKVVPSVAQAIVPTCSAGQVLTGTVSGLQCVAGGTGLSDGDGDTQIQLDEGNLDDDSIRFDTDGFERMIIDSNGNIGVGTSTPTYEMEVIGTVRADDVLYTSDRRYKENIEALGADKGLSLIETLNPVRFNWKDKERDQRDHLGLIAQEVEEVLPELVGGTEEKKAVDYMGLVPVLIKAIQQQQEQIEDLNSKIEMLEQQNHDTVAE